ncbi:hypothetical protein HYALB_00007118 [Hymenoscyphus albidus]|uniref:Secreted protein n=1 Tax=Hymenoscyphus albidus TaxID=595503 RepID=A0A9N9QBT9_9HELO|nr:hypothetical protein HYALB_00007118 [Hymenoscyphus albidus]
MMLAITLLLNFLFLLLVAARTIKCCQDPRGNTQAWTWADEADLTSLKPEQYSTREPQAVVSDSSLCKVAGRTCHKAAGVKGRTRAGVSLCGEVCGQLIDEQGGFRVLVNGTRTAGGCVPEVCGFQSCPPVVCV